MVEEGEVAAVQSQDDLDVAAAADSWKDDTRTVAAWYRSFDDADNVVVDRDDDVGCCCTSSPFLLQDGLEPIEPCASHWRPLLLPLDCFGEALGIFQWDESSRPRGLVDDDIGLWMAVGGRHRPVGGDARDGRRILHH